MLVILRGKKTVVCPLFRGNLYAAWTAAGAAGGFTWGLLNGGIQPALQYAVVGAGIGASIYSGYNLAMRGVSLMNIASQPVGSWGGPDIAAKMLAKDIGYHYVSHEARKQVADFAERNGMSLSQFNSALLTLSFAGNKLPYIGESRFKAKSMTMVGFYNRGVPGLPFDVVDTVLEYQGIPSASGFDYMSSTQRGKPISSGHSLGALTVANLVGLGVAPSGSVYALPLPKVAPSGVGVVISNGDVINGFFLGKVTNPDADLRSGPLFGHAACGVPYNPVSMCAP